MTVLHISLKPVLKRGALLAAANWPVVFLQFAAESVFKVLLAVPVAGGVLIVALVLESDFGTLIQADLRTTLATIVTALADRPLALAAFVIAALIVLLGGSAFVFAVKAGTVTVMVEADERAGPIEQRPLRLSSLTQAAQFSIDRFLGGCSRVAGRYLMLGFGLLSMYGMIAACFVLVTYEAFRLLDQAPLTAIGTLLTIGASSVVFVAVLLTNLAYLLLQMIVAAEDCSVPAACGRLFRFLQHAPREVAGVFGIMLVLVVVAVLASILATAGLGLIAFVPLAGLAVVPLQVAAWLVRGLLFQYLGLTTLGAYLTVYRGRPAHDQLAGLNEKSGRPSGMPGM